MTWKTCSIRASILSNVAVVGLLTLVSCAHPGSFPAWDVEIWPGKPEIGGVVHTDTNGTVRTMKATDPYFSKGAWISYNDLRKAYILIQSCKEWKKGTQMMSAQEAIQRFEPLMEDMKRAAALEELERLEKLEYQLEGE